MIESNKPLDLCLVAGRFFPHYAGPAERFRRYAPGLCELGVGLRVITMRRSDDEREIDRVDDILVERRSVSTDNDPTRTNTSRLLPNVIQGFRTSGQWPDVLQLLTPPMKTDVPYLWQARAHGLPVLLVSTMMLTEISNLRDRLYNWWIFSPFNRMVTSSSVMTDQLSRLALSPGRIETIPNGVDCQRFRPAGSPEERAELRQKFGFEPDDEIIIYVGSITPRKGVDILVLAWQEIIRQRPHARLLLVGPHRRPPGLSPSNDIINAFCDQVDALINQSLAPARVTFTGEVSHVEEYLRLADVFVFPSSLEGMPNVVPEAMAVGLPCVVMPFKGLSAEFGQPGRDYLLVEHQPFEIAKAVLKLLNDNALYMNFSKNAFNWVKDNLNVKISLSRYAQLYGRLSKS